MHDKPSISTARASRRSTGFSSLNPVMESLREASQRPSQLAKKQVEAARSIMIHQGSSDAELTDDEEDAPPPLCSEDDSSSRMGNVEDDTTTIRSIDVNGIVTDKSGVVKGRLSLQVIVKDAGSEFACGPASRKCSLNRSLSLSGNAANAVEVIAESVCHLLTVEGTKLRALRQYYGCLPIEGMNAGKNMYMKFRSVSNRRRSSFSVAGLSDKLSMITQTNQTPVNDPLLVSTGQLLEDVSRDEGCAAAEPQIEGDEVVADNEVMCLVPVLLSFNDVLAERATRHITLLCIIRLKASK